MDEPPIATSPDAETAHKIGHKSARNPRIEVITRSDRRRIWTLDQKREIVAESLGPGLTPTEVARKHAISSGQLFTWRQQVLGGQMRLLSHAQPEFAQVEMTPAPQPRKRCGGHRIGFELTIDAAANPAVKPPGCESALKWDPFVS